MTVRTCLGIAFVQIRYFASREPQKIIGPSNHNKPLIESHFKYFGKKNVLFVQKIFFVDKKKPTDNYTKNG